MAEDRYVFTVEWFDSAASLVRNYNLTYFLKDKSIEMVTLSSSSSTSKINAFSSNAANTQAFSSRTSLWVPSSMSTPDNSKLLTTPINTPAASSKHNVESSTYLT